MHHNFYDWWTHSNAKDRPPFGTTRTSIWVGPPDQVQVMVLPEFKMESSEEGLIVYSPMDVAAIFLAPIDVNGVRFRMGYDPSSDTVYASQDSYIPVYTDDLEGEN